MASARLKLSLIALGLLAVAVILVVSRAALGPEDPGAAIEVSGRMPSLEGPTLAGDGLSREDYAEKVVVVNFWADWCGPCREEQPALQRLAAEYDGSVQFIGVNFRDDQAKAREYLREFGVTYPSVEDPDGRLGHEFGIPSLPATVLVDAAGEMRLLLLGAQTEERLRGFLDELLAG